MLDFPLVSVIVPAYNAGPLLEDALRSALAQTYSSLEVIAVDDGSTDDTAARIERLARTDRRLRLLQQANQGVAAARNRGIEASRGAFIAPLDADDVWHPEKIERQVQSLEEQAPDAGVSYTWWTSVNDQGRVLDHAHSWRLDGNVYEALVYFNFVGNASVPLIRRSCLDHVGGYDASFLAADGQGCEDWDLLLRLAEHYPFVATPGYLSGYRRVWNSMSENTTAMYRSYELTMEGVRRRLPGVSDVLLRWSRAHFLLYLGGVCYGRGHFDRARHWWKQAIRIDPWVLISPEIIKKYGLSLLRHSLRPLTRHLWATQADWIAFKESMTQASQPRFSSTAMLVTPDVEPALPIGWRADVWRPYSWVRARRWQWIVRRMERDEASRPPGAAASPTPIHASAPTPPQVDAGS